VAAGTFLMRFSSSKPGSFALAFTNAPQKVTHVIIRTTPDGFSIFEQSKEKIFANLSLLVENYSSMLTTAFDSTLPEEPWFYGDLSGEEAEKLLTGKKTGTFLIRFSSQPSYFAGSYVDAQGKVGKCLIAR
jgi:hypothetical protein